jgi:hypothetical protein
MSYPTPATPNPTPAMPNPQGMSHPWVYSANITNGKITFRVEVTDLKATTGAIEISGIATQVNGAYTPLYRIINIPTKPNGDPNDQQEAGKYFLPVEATPTADHPFSPDEDVTVFVRVSKVWVTVLGPGSDDEGSGRPGPESTSGGAEPAQGPTWGKHKADSHVSATEGEPPVSVTSTSAA